MMNGQCYRCEKHRKATKSKKRQAIRISMRQLLCDTEFLLKTT